MAERRQRPVPADAAAEIEDRFGAPEAAPGVRSFAMSRLYIALHLRASPQIRLSEELYCIGIGSMFEFP